MSSIVLVGLYVAYRSGGQTTTTTTSLPGSKGGIVRLNGAATNPTSAPATGPVIITDPLVIYSSKSAPVFKPGAFSGSKSAAVFHPSDTTFIVPGSETSTSTTHPTTAPAQPPQPPPALNQATPQK
jgi:hypothetical protein